MNSTRFLFQQFLFLGGPPNKLGTRTGGLESGAVTEWRWSMVTVLSTHMTQARQMVADSPMFMARQVGETWRRVFCFL